MEPKLSVQHIGEVAVADSLVHGVTRLVPFGPTPIAVFEEDARLSYQPEIVRVACTDGESALSPHAHLRRSAGGADSSACPASSVFC